jgi:ABC-type multidrug transport system ATPase subunit
MSDQGLLGILQVYTPAGGQDLLPLYRPIVTLGRSQSNDVILEDARVSGQHAQLNLGREGWMIGDLDSSNGTSVEGQRLAPRRPVALGPSSRVQIGSFVLHVWVPGRDEAPPPRPGERVRINPKQQPGLAIYHQHGLQKLPLDKDVVTVGRKPGNDLVIADSLVSSRHARLERQGDSYCIIDLDSTNGLTYQGKRVRQHVLADGDVLYIGPSIALQYRAHVGFLPAEGDEADARKAQPPQTRYLDMRSLPKAGDGARAGGRRITIGRHRSNVLVIEHPRVSRYHAVIEQFGARFRLRDLNSDNGTFVNGKRVEKEAWIKEGDEIKIGSHRLVFKEDGITHFDEAGNLRLDALRVEKWYSKTANILKKVSLSIYPKEFVALVGASGAGKSTLMNALTGFSPANGEKSRVLVNGQDLYAHMDEYRSEMGYVPQEDIIHRELTVYSALDFAAQLRMPADTTKQERHERVMEVIEELGLTRQKNNLLTALSGGQRKRVSIGVELLTKPGLFFLDEATSGLDPGTETEMMELLRELADGGRTVILVTHATKNVMMCDQVVFLAKGGYLAYYGPPNEALDYFETYRTAEERRYKEKVEFDDIYQLLEKRGTPEEWGERFRKAPQFQEYVVKRLHGLQEQQKTPTPGRLAKPQRKRQISSFRQFLILSVRNLRIMTQDKIGLALMLAVAPMIGLMDFMWGRELFDLEQGNAAQIITMLFMMGLIGILTGALSSVREIVKEVDIYRRERTVVLKLLPYIMSKVWVGVVLAAYQATVFLIAKKVFVNPQLEDGGYLALYVTIFLCTLSGYMLGLLISAASPNQNIALFLVVIVLVPQFLFAGALLPRDLIPGGEALSAIISTRWAFASLVRTTGIGTDIINDPCWQRPKEEWDDLTQEDKDRLGCRCMGTQMFEMCNFPGIRSPDYYDAEAREALDTEKPAEPPTPTPFPTLTPYPTLTPPPRPSDILADQQAYEQKLRQQGTEYENLRLAQGSEYEDLRSGQGEEYRQLSLTYGEELRAWESDRAKSVRGAEGTIGKIYEDYGWTFQEEASQGWLALGIISLVVLALTVAFQKRKDVI